MRLVSRRRRIAASVGGVTAAVALLLLTVPSAASYTDASHARTERVAAAAEPSFQPGISESSRMVDTGLGLSNDGRVYVWGLTSLNINGGAADPGGQRAPQSVPFPAGTVIKQITGQIYDVNALDSEGRVWGWGAYNDRNGTDAPRAAVVATGTPQRVRVGTAWNGTGALLDDILTIASTEYAGAGIRADGTVWHWGAPVGYGGNSGAGAAQLAGLPDPRIAGNRPVYLKGAYTNFFVILENGDVYYWGGVGGSSLPAGARNVGATATHLTQLNAWMKRSVSSGSPYIVAVDGGINMGAALLSDGRLVSWGTDPTRTGRGGPTAPAVIPTLSSIVSMQFGFTGVAMMDASGRLWGYGASDDYGRFPMTPAVIDSNVVQFAAGQGFYLWQRSNGTFWGRGYNPQGAIGTPIGTQTANRQINWNLGAIAQ